MNLSKENVYNELKVLIEDAYAGNSKIGVSCIIYLKDGTQIKGVNVEIATYISISLCRKSSITSNDNTGLG